MLSLYTYRDPYSSLVTRMDYGTWAYRFYNYDDLDRLTEEGISGTVTKAYKYDKRNNLIRTQDFDSGVTTDYAYDLIGRITNIKTNNNQRVSYVYDNLNRLSQSKYILNNVALNTQYIYGDNTISGQKNGLIYGVKLNSLTKLSYSYDKLTRLKTRTLATSIPFVTEYSFLQGNKTGTTTTLVEKVKNGDDILQYTYDKLGNISEIRKNGTVVESYTYDNLNQLKTVTNGTDTWEYTYDNGGNILSVKKNGVAEKTYTYGDSEWKDLLTNYNGINITYDAIGNPLTYRDGISMQWVGGRRLAAITKGTDNISYSYDTENLRTSKTVNGTTTEYYWLNGQLQGQKTGSEHIIFLYDENGTAYGFLLKNGTTEEYYYYIFNAQGDVIGILDSTGTQVVEYTYNVWGEVLSITGTLADTIGQKNPIRYRGYYYDEETGFYLTGTRYYDPEIGRFINADSLIDNRGIITQNLFQYCGNNPVNNADPSGNLFGAIVGIGLLVIGMVATLSGCSSKPAATTSTPSTPSKPSTPSSSTSSTTPPHIPTPQEKSYAATVYAEAGGQNKRSKQAVAHVMNNRIGTRSSWTDIEAVISAPYQFEGYNSPMYRAAMDYYDKGICDNSIDRSAMDECLAVVIPIYSGAEADITGGALYFHSFPNPSDWPYHNSLTQVYVSGTEKFWFYK